MATGQQVPVPQQQRGEAGLLPVHKQQKAADRKNRRALADIGHLVNANVRPVEGQLQPQITRPVTRSFGALLLHDAHSVAAPQKTLGKSDGDGGAARKGVPGPTKPRATAKPNPESVIEISPDTAEEPAGKKRESSKKRVDTLSSVLTARSKAACGMIDKPVEAVHDIDSPEGPDAGDQLAVVDYVEDIYKFYKLSENSSRPRDYMGSQTQINAKMRAVLADWLIEVHHRFELMPETLYLTLYIIDRYLSMEMVLRRELQLVGITCMLIACKYEEIWAPEVNDFICISDRAYSREEILAKEKGILDKLEWNLTVPTPYVFLVRFLKAASSDKEMECMVFFFAELGLMHYSMVPYCPSMFAASAIYAARITLNKNPQWNETLKRHTGYSDQQLMECSKLLVEFHSSAAESKLKAVYKKYSSPQCGEVALHTPAMKLSEEMNGST
uniref:Cyclin-B1-1 n=1 Tax=Anthurium amnicola TaxID=1678845 RepID=A0A1D1YTW4_9ARAE